MVKSAKNYYEILGVTPDVETVELKKVYRRLVRRFHPDINPDGGVIFKDITEAYETLSNEKLRSQYDTINGFFKKAKTAENPQEPYRKTFHKADEFKTSGSQTKKNFEKKSSQSKKSVEHQKTVSNEDKILSSMINEIIDGFSQFSCRKKAPKAPKPQDGADVFADVAISLKESLCGTQKVVNLIHTTICPHCGGHKFINGAKCPECGGRGEVTKHQKISVKIPAHIKNGAKLRLAGEGKKGFNGGKNGDLYLKIKVAKSSFFTQDGNDLLCELPISPFEAVLGGEIKIPAFDGDVLLNLPKNTKSGQVFRISTKSLQQNNLVGDIIVTVRIQIPETLSDDEIKLYEKLREVSGSNLRESLFND